MKMLRREAIVETMNFAFHAIVTSGTLLACAGVLIGMMISEAAIVDIGKPGNRYPGGYRGHLQLFPGNGGKLHPIWGCGISQHRL